MSKIKTIEGNYSNAAASYAIAVAKFNSFIVDRLLDGALDALKKHGVPFHCEILISKSFTPCSKRISLLLIKNSFPILKTVI